MASILDSLLGLVGLGSEPEPAPVQAMPPAPPMTLAQIQAERLKAMEAGDDARAKELFQLMVSRQQPTTSAAAPVVAPAPEPSLMDRLRGVDPLQSLKRPGYKQ